MATLRSEVNNLKRIVSNLRGDINELHAEKCCLLEKLEAEQRRSLHFETEKARADYSSGASQQLSQISKGTFYSSVLSQYRVCALFSYCFVLCFSL